MTSGSSEGFELTEHPADIGIRAYARTREGALRFACLGLMAIMTDTTRVVPRIERSLSIEDAEPAVVLRRVLSEILFVSSSQNLVFSRFEVVWTDTVDVRCFGEEIDPESHELYVEVKAITNSKLTFEKGIDGWSSFVLVDV